ncbi:MAG TPA: hypothetical protein VLL96_04420 [Candidatus Deferrimicrobiaceae bacterium]|nr:hypothetical protein [Candidatus Deferrimicrobiaceae bacterium]
MPSYEWGANYKLNRRPDGYLLEIELNNEDFGEFIRHSSDANLTFSFPIS